MILLSRPLKSISAVRLMPLVLTPSSSSMWKVKTSIWHVTCMCVVNQMLKEANVVIQWVYLSTSHWSNQPIKWSNYNFLSYPEWRINLSDVIHQVYTPSGRGHHFDHRAWPVHHIMHIYVSDQLKVQHWGLFYFQWLALLSKMPIRRTYYSFYSTRLTSGDRD